MKLGYYQVEILETNKERTVFIVRQIDFYRYNRTPFDLFHSQATHQQLMENCLADLDTKILCIFIDDAIIFGRKFEKHLEHMRLVFDRIRSASHKHAKKKCQPSNGRSNTLDIKYHKSGLKIDPDFWPTLKNTG